MTDEYRDALENLTSISSRTNSRAWVEAALPSRLSLRDGLRFRHGKRFRVARGLWPLKITNVAQRHRDCINNSQGR